MASVDIIIASSISLSDKSGAVAISFKFNFGANSDLHLSLLMCSKDVVITRCRRTVAVADESEVLELLTGDMPRLSS